MDNKITGYDAFRVRFFGPTNNKPSRIRITDLFPGGGSVTISWLYRFDNARDQAIDYLQGKGAEVIGWVYAGEHWLILTERPFNLRGGGSSGL